MLEEKDENSIVAVRNASGHQGENERQSKKANRNTCGISSIKFVTNKSHVLVVQNNGIEMCKKVCCTCKVVVVVVFFLIRPIVFFLKPFSLPSPFRIIQF